MKFAGLVVAVCLCSCLAGCKSASSNPLIGKWTSTTDPNATGAAGCSTGYVFTSDSYTNMWKGQQSTTLISYVVQPGEVFVVGQVGSTGYKFTGPDTMMMDAGYEDCTYKRD
jgi:hypothetical protein